jgi:hypothetical protein
LLTTNYNRQADSNLIALWQGLFKGFDPDIFGKACLEIIRTKTFFPAASEIISVYKDIKHNIGLQRLEGLKEKHLLLTSNSDQVNCGMCGNTGTVTYVVGEYSYPARCDCLHGKDLNASSSA